MRIDVLIWIGFILTCILLVFFVNSNFKSYPQVEGLRFFEKIAKIDL